MYACIFLCTYTVMCFWIKDSHRAYQSCTFYIEETWAKRHNDCISSSNKNKKCLHLKDKDYCA